MAKILLSDSIHEAIVDDDLFEDLNKYVWHLVVGNYTNYAQRWDQYPHAVFMHRQIMNPGFNLITHHKDKNGLNNLRSNLENLTYPEHGRLHAKKQGITSTCRGVHFEFARGKWKSIIRVQGSNVFLGRFDSEEEASVAYETAYKNIFGNEEDNA